jgi:coenzyme PQQ synthesis protein D (PqqD)
VAASEPLVRTVPDHPRRRADVSVRAVGKEMLVLDREAEQIHQLNSTASFIWHRCDGRRTAGAITQELTDAFDVDPDTAKDAVLATLGQLAELGLLHHARNSGPHPAERP